MIKRFSAYGFLKNLQFFEPFLYLYFLSKGFSFLEIGVLVSIRELSMYVFEIPTGIIADMFGKKSSMLLCFILYIFSFIIFGLSVQYYLIALAMIVFAGGEAFRTGTHKAIIMDWLDKNGIPEKKTHVYGITRSWSKIGSAVNAVIAALLVFFYVKGTNSDYNIIFLASIIPYVAGFILILTYPRDNTGGEKRSIIKGGKEHFSGTFRALKQNVRLLLNSSVYDGIFKVSKDYIQPMIKNSAIALPLLAAYSVEKRNALVIGAVYLIINIFSAVCSRMSGTFKDRFCAGGKGENFIFMSAGIVCLLIAFFYNAGIFTLTVIMYLIGVALFDIRRPLLVAHIGDGVSKKQRATVLSVESMLKTFITALLAPAVGFSVDRWGVEAVFVICGVLLLVLFFPLRLRFSTGEKEGKDDNT